MQPDASTGRPPLISTKIQVPRRRPDLLPRQRLLRFIQGHLDRKLILISAPAGFGKTTLLTDFAHDTELPVCWYTLDPFDRDLRLFLEYLIAALARRFPAFGQRSRAFLQEIGDPARDLYGTVAVVVQEIYDAIPEYFVLVLDDHHTVEDQSAINEFLALFTTYVDENCHLILASRTLPALSNLSLLVARRQAAGLSIDELRFTPREVQALAEKNYDRELSLEQASSLAERTGGWITGLLLAAAPAWQQAGTGDTIRGRIDVDVYDYLSSQVLDSQPAPLREFLLASSVLDELSPALCAAVLDGEYGDPAARLDQVRARHLFVVEFEGDADHLRYHDLFHEFLRASLRRLDEARYRALTRRAAAAYADRAEWDRAVSRYLELGDFGRVAAIVEETATALHEAGRWDTLAGWIDALPPAQRTARPQFLVQRAKIHMERGEHSAALALYDQAEQAFRAAGDQTGMASAIALKGYVLRFQGHYARALDRSREALSLIRGSSRSGQATRAMAHKNAGLCHLRMGHLAQSRQSLEEARVLYDLVDDRYDVGSVLHDLGLVHELAGDLGGAVAHYQAALQRWQQLGNPSPWANSLNGLGVVYHRQGKYEEALATLAEALDRARQAGDLRVQALTLASLGDVHQDLANLEQARGAYETALEVASRADSGFVLTYAHNGLGNVYRRQDDAARAKEHLRQAFELARAHDSAYELGLCHTSLGILAGEEGSAAEARQHFDRAVELFARGGFRQDLARANLHRAGAAFAAGDRGQALADLEQSLSLAEELALTEFLVPAARDLRSLLRYALEQGAGGGQIVHLVERVEAFQARVGRQAEPAIVAEPEPTLRIYALGQARVDLNGQAVQWTTTQSRDLFFYFVQHPLGLRKEEIGQAFWPEHEPRRLNNIFRSTLYRLRRSLFRDSIVLDGELYQFNRQVAYWSDVEAFEGRLDRAKEMPGEAAEKLQLLEEAVALYQGDYLAGIYDDWCSSERRWLKERYLAAVETLAGLEATRQNPQLAIQLYQRILAEDPYHEAAHRGIMRSYHQQGDRAAAIRQYQRCFETLREDLGLSPMPETEDLYRQIIE